MILKLAQPKERRMRGGPRGNGGYQRGAYNSSIPPPIVPQPYGMTNHGHAGFGNVPSAYVPSLMSLSQSGQYSSVLNYLIFFSLSKNIRLFS